MTAGGLAATTTSDPTPHALRSVVCMKCVTEVTCNRAIVSLLAVIFYRTPQLVNQGAGSGCVHLQHPRFPHNVTHAGPKAVERSSHRLR